MNKSPITVETIIKAPMEKVWDYWNKPEHIVHWAFASDDWEARDAENDVRVGGKFKTTMAAKNGSEKFDFKGTYSAVKEHELMEYDMSDPEGDASRPNGASARHVKVTFTETEDGVKVVETFDPENENPAELQRSGWQAFLDNFKKHVESN